MKKRWKKAISLILSLAMVFTMAGTSLAANTKADQSVSISAVELNRASRGMKYKTVPAAEKPEFIYTPGPREAYVQREERIIPTIKSGSPAILKAESNLPKEELVSSNDFEITTAYPTSDKEGKNVRFFEVTNAYTDGGQTDGIEGALDPKYPFFFKAAISKKEGSTETYSPESKYLRLTINDKSAIVASVDLDNDYYTTASIVLNDLNRIEHWYEVSLDENNNVVFNDEYSFFDNGEPLSFGVKPGKVKVKAEIIDTGDYIDHDIGTGDPIDEPYIIRNCYYSEEFEMTIESDTEEDLKPYVQGSADEHITFYAKQDIVEIEVAIPSYEYKGEDDAYILLTKGDEIVGTSLKGLRTTTDVDYDDRYGDGWDKVVTRPKMVLSGAVELYKYISEGSYNVVAGINGDEYVIENGAIAYDGTEPHITGQSVVINSFVDATNKYVFVRVEGSNFDPTKITPVICSSGNKALTKDTPAAVTEVWGGDYVYKLEKVEGASFDNYEFGVDEYGNLLTAEEGEPQHYSQDGYYPVKYVGASVKNAELPAVGDYARYLPFSDDEIEKQGYCGAFDPDALQTQEETFITTPVYNYKEKEKATAEFGLQNAADKEDPYFLKDGDKIHIALSQNKINLLSESDENSYYPTVTGFDKNGLAASGTIPFTKGGSISIALDGELEYGREYYWAVFAEKKGDEGAANTWILLDASKDLNYGYPRILDDVIYNTYPELITWYNYDGPGPVDPNPGPSPAPEPEEPAYEFDVLSDNSILVYPTETTELNLEVVARYGGLFTDKTELVPVLKNEYGRFIEMGPALKYEKYEYTSDDEEDEGYSYGRFYLDWTISEPLHDVGAIDVELYIKDKLPGKKDLNAAKRMDAAWTYSIGHFGGGMYVVDDGFYVRGNKYHSPISMITDFDGTVYFQLMDVNYLGHDELIGAAAKDLWDALGYDLEISGYNRFDEGEEFKPLTDWSIRGYRYDPTDGFTLMIDGLPDSTVVPGIFAKFTKLGIEPVYIGDRNDDYSFIQYYPSLSDLYYGIGPVVGVGEFFTHSSPFVTMHSMDKDDPHAYYGVTVAEKDMATVTVVARDRVTLDEVGSFTVDKFESNHGLVSFLGSSSSDPSGTCYFNKNDFFNGWREEGIYRLSAICTYDEYGQYSWVVEGTAEPGAPGSNSHQNDLNRYSEYDCIGYLGEAEDKRLWEEEPWVCTVYFETGRGASIVYPQNVNKGEKAIRPEDPVKEGFEFDGWYDVDNPTVPFNFDTPIEKDYDLFAAWKVDLFSENPLADVLDAPEHHNSGEGKALSSNSARYLSTDVTKLSTFIGGMKLDISLKFAGVSRNETCSYRYTVSDKKVAKINKDAILVPKKRTHDGTPVTVNLEEKAKGGTWTTISSCEIFVQVPTVEKKKSVKLDEVSNNAVSFIKDTTYRPTAFISTNPAVLEIDKITGAFIPKKKGSVKIIYVYGGQTTKDKASTKKRYKTTVKVGG